MKTILEMSDEERIEFFKERAKPEHKYMTINVSSWHMSIFPQFHEDKAEVEQKLLHEKEDPMCYSIVRLVYDLSSQEVFYRR